MAIALLLAVVFDAPPVRTMRAGLERKYRVTVVQEAGDRFEYRLRARVSAPVAPKLPKIKLPKGASPPLETLLLDLRLADYRATVGERKISAPLIGGGQMDVAPNGLPVGLNVTGPLGPVWLPVLAFYLPASGEDGKFTVPSTPVAPGLDLLGKGTIGKGRFDLEGTFQAGAATLARLTLATTLDREGWPVKAEGTLVSEDGTYRFTLARG